MKSMIAMIAAISMMLLAGCQSTQPSQQIQQETNECMHYRAMMTAPMAPDAMQRLKVECEQSREHEVIKQA
ncbi:hypothetical protein ACL9RI_21235 [Janthinobacterium sp. Mn2066]|uniref:hypothetical protein n=1 Tax=Janthinobacterium sp. Mn2066 TaxID=3395264 RepID=UPI003BBF9536